LQKIYKYVLEGVENKLNLPKNHKALSVINQYDKVTLYCLVNPEEELVETKYFIVGTGWELKDYILESEFIGTVAVDDGTLIWHVFKGQ